MVLKVTEKEKCQLQYLLPVQGSLKTLELVEQILVKADIQGKDAESDDIVKIEFTDEEIDFLLQMIQVLDQAQKLSFPSLSFVKKIMNTRS